jgi:hypothetical protein
VGGLGLRGCDCVTPVFMCKIRYSISMASKHNDMNIST